MFDLVVKGGDVFTPSGLQSCDLGIVGGRFAAIGSLDGGRAAEVLEAINDKTSVVTFSLGSGPHGDAIFSFVADVCGEPSEEDRPPKHAHAFGDLGRLHAQMYEERVAALRAFHDETTAGNFPYPANNTTMHEGEHEMFLDALDKAT